ncbi:MAG TPA: HAMP domain-containing sensor histidine kinase [Solirubrobacteraceae bacterium]|jgi:two-component system sensor histidine kinase MprB|nr:HAMP domain-containing sensor histidine kinase [Solirubrobacteraceae bacterium]
MSFRRRMVLLAAGAVAAAIVIASVVVYVVTGNELRGQIDASLRQKLTPGLPQSVQIRTVSLKPGELAKLKREGRLAPGAAAQLGYGGSAAGRLSSGGSSSSHSEESLSEASGAQGVHGEVVSIEGSGSSPPSGSTRKIRPKALHLLGPLNKLVLPAPRLGGAMGYVQLFQSNGQLVHSEGKGSLLPVTAATRAVAAGRSKAFFSDEAIAGTHVRVLTERAPEVGGVWQVALPLTDVDSTLTNLKLVLALVCLGGIALAAALGLLVSRTALIPVRRLTGAAERVARTQDLRHRIQAGSDDDLGRLADSFNTMLAALERSRLAQRQLVSDASHELRTPLTSVQANLDALAIGEELPVRERARVLAAARAQLRELTVLVGDLVDLSKTEVEEIEVEDVRLDLATTGALERARLHAPECRIVLDAEPCLVRAAPARLERAIANLLDNACKWNQPACAREGAPAGGPVEVRVRAGVLEVRDHGPGIAVEDLPRVFDRFYRSPTARARPGSGLGLAIVRQMAEAHGGVVHAANDPDGGARLTLELPPLQMTDAELAASASDAPTMSDVA